MKLTLVHLCALALSLLACSSTPQNPTLCELAADMDSFANRTVTVEGTLLVSKHGSAVTDASCGKGIAISWNAPNEALRELNDAVDRAQDLPDRQLPKVRVTGQMRRVPRSPMLDEPYWELRLSSAQVL